ncbi:bifunctional diguanylate cyclase/phosphodiesterase [Bacillus cihuensis]|uniref:bifunctional diguanylate cyclase/phosphodiesterase n=1 Tax=Bacillus cihuensis TaxID=1208599 RepID=UPI0003FC8480|nr:bifunctional diguanylate cyclase/phosphodiesterase [Bacillus cihuensis]
MEHIHGTHDITVVALSFIIAFLASLTALDLARRVNFSKGWKRNTWLFSGSTAMGFGIWAMHFIAMLAFKLPVPIHYNVYLVVISIVVAIVASLCGLYFICHPKMNMAKLCIGGTFMGLGISGMHYIGMAAMEGIHIMYHPYPFALSILIAIGASIIALMLAFQFREAQKGINNLAKYISGGIMGVAIAGMHYTGMEAATFTLSHLNPGNHTVANHDSDTIVIFVAISAVIILGIVLVSSFILDKRLNEEIAFKGAILESVLDCVIIINHQGNIIECNPAVEKIFEYSRQEIIEQNMEKKLFLHSSLSNMSFSTPFIQTNEKWMLNKRFEVTGVRKSGEEFPVEMTITRIKKDGLPVYTVYARDITEFKNVEKTIKQMAYHDTLTGLPNRRMFHKKLEQSLIEAKEHHSTVAVAFLDLDRFKNINDSMGHALGDLLLCGVANRLSGCLDDEDVVSRNGGDEFTIILNDTSEQDVIDTAERIIHSLLEPFNLEDHEVFVTTSIGISMYPRDGKDSETLIKNADAAMYKTKESGKNGFSFYQPASGPGTPHQLQLETELRRALERNEFEVYYQPQFNTNTNEIIGVEALVRWNHPERGMIQPVHFIPLAEETGLIVPLGNWVLRSAVIQCKKWQKSDSIQLSVNFSALQFQNPTIISVIKEILDEADFNPSLLTIEITESIAMDVDYSIEVLRNLKTMGIKISMDDFGTKYSSLGFLKKMPIDHLKIDRSFMSNVMYDSDDAAIVKAIISMAHSLNINVIAEGVEDENQLSFLKDLKCNEIQGFLLSPPVSVENFEVLLQKYTTNMGNPL